MSKIKTLIVEDELIIAEDMKGMLRDLEHDVIGIAGDCDEAEEIIARDIPDLVLIDIHLRGADDGITLAQFIRKKYDIPIVFITSFSDKNTVERAKQVMPEGYLVKPFEKADLYTSIEIALCNYTKKQKPESINPSEEADNLVIKDCIFIRKDYMLVKVKFEDLIWIRSEMNYLELHCKENKHLIRSTLKEFIDKLPPACFIQVHRSYAINCHYITAIDHNNVWLQDVQIPIGRSYQEIIKKSLGIEI
ncbi:MAG: response regulator [Bacteroidales bacterium]|nr:response regulator [Bacteroidales bacterium]